MWYQTDFSKELNITYPIIQAPMAGGPTTPELIGCVSNQGGLGSLGAAYMTAEAMAEAIDQIRRLTDKPFAVNLFAPQPKIDMQSIDQQSTCEVINEVCNELKVTLTPVTPPFCPDFDEQFAVLLDKKVPVFSFTFGVIADDYLEKLRSQGTKLIGTATCLFDAKLLAEKSVDVIVAQGVEAGGHRGTFANSIDEEIPTMTLVRTLTAELNCPVVAAGGIGDANRMAEVLTHGAQGVQLGTLFLTTTESGANPVYKQALQEFDGSNETVLTKAFSGRFARAIKNKFVAAMQTKEQFVLPFPLHNKLTKLMRAKSVELKNPEFMSLWASQSAVNCQSISANELMKKLIDEMNSLMGS